MLLYPLHDQPEAHRPAAGTSCISLLKFIFKETAEKFQIESPPPNEQIPPTNEPPNEILSQPESEDSVGNGYFEPLPPDVVLPSETENTSIFTK